MTERIGVLGGGILGIAVARAIVQRGAATEVTVLEKERRLARHQTGRNSGVVHAGIYYAPGSLKARLCRLGRSMLQEYCADKQLPFRELGKLVVALGEDQLAALTEVEDRARANGVPGLERIDDAERMREVEPHVGGRAALHSPHTAAVDYAAITESLAQDVREGGGSVLLGHEVTGVRRTGSRVTVVTDVSEHTFDRLIVCAGLQSDRIARMVGADASPRIMPFRGEYWSMTRRGSDLVRGMIYPVPDLRYPFLGIHFTRGVYDDVHVGPNAVPALAREGYRWSDVSPRDAWESFSTPGSLAFARRHWRMGMGEIGGSMFKRAYFDKARRFVPELRMSDLSSRAASGVRAQAMADDGSLVDDFVVDERGPVVVVRNAPSPAATSSLAIAEHVLDHHVIASGR